jgi:DNA-binding response OmpR family regulator
VAAQSNLPRVLIVEDDETIRETLIQILEDEGYVATSAADGQVALDRLMSSAETPDLIILDLMMPTMSGWEFHTALRRDPRHAETPVLVVSADATVAEQVRGMANVTGLKKPFDVETLLATLGKLCPSAAR